MFVKEHAAAQVTFSEQQVITRRIQNLRDTNNPKTECEGWDSGQQVRCANSRFSLNFETKSDLKLFAM
jgi:hypothetical protein